MNGYVVYTRRKRINHHSENEEFKRLKTEENVQVKVETVSAEAVRNDVVLWTSKRQRKPSYKMKVESEQDASAVNVAVRVAKENTNTKSIVVNKKPMTVKELFDTGLLDGVPVVYVGCKKQVIFFFLHFFHLHFSFFHFCHE